MQKITFRPHHFLCALCFQGKGYSDTFVNNFAAIMQSLNSAEGDNTPITVVDHTDSICTPCPHKQGTHCETQEKIDPLDHAHGKALNIKGGDVLSWGEAKQRIKENITLEKFDQICVGCSWKAFGICESVLRNFISEN